MRVQSYVDIIVKIDETVIPNLPVCCQCGRGKEDADYENLFVPGHRFIQFTLLRLNTTTKVDPGGGVKDFVSSPSSQMVRSEWISATMTGS